MSVVVKNSASNKIVIASYARTPIGKFRGGLSSLTAPQLGAIAIQAAVSKVVPPGVVVVVGEEEEESESSSSSSSSLLLPTEVFLGNVVSAGIGQAPARQATIGSGILPESTICTTINKVCASGMKATMLGAQTLLTDSTQTSIVTGGMESMSNIPHYVMSSRTGTTLGHATMTDGLIHDGLWDCYNDQHMGMCAEKVASDMGFSRADQDAYCLETYARAQQAIQDGLFQDEIVPVTILPPPTRRDGEATDVVVVDTDEEPMLMGLPLLEEKVPTLKPAFDRVNGTVTAANASSLNDGAAAMVLMREEDALAHSDVVTPLARILGWGDAARAPVDFTIAPSLAVPVAYANSGVGLTEDDVDYHEINEAFSVVVMANMKLMGITDRMDKVNVLGGAVALGHPIGMSGARILGTLMTVLREKDGTIGCASICNGGGGASAMVLERMN